MTINRRQLLKALGLGAAFGPSLSFAAPGFPKRIVFFVQPHGHVPNSWALPGSSGPVTQFTEHDLAGMAEADLPAVLRPLYPWRQKLLAIAGLAHTSVLDDIANVSRSGGDLNNHNIAVAGLLSGSRAAQHSGFPCTGGAITIDQVLAQRTGGPGRFGSRVYGGDYVPNQTVAPFSFLGSSQASPLVKNPVDALADLLGTQPVVGERAQKLRMARTSALDSVAEEYRLQAARLGREAHDKLESHRALVRDLERSLATDPITNCNTSFDPTGHTTRQFMRLIRMAFACDLTRVATYAAPVPPCPEFAYPAEADVHGSYAHASVQGFTSCGQTYTPMAEHAMTDLSVWYAQHLAYLLSELASVPEGDGTLLDNTVVVWQTELGTPTHQHHDAFTVLMGGCQNFFRTGRYVQYPAEHDNPVTGAATWWARVGPAHNRLYVSLLQAMGQADTSFGTRSTVSNSGEAIDLTGPLLELHR